MAITIKSIPILKRREAVKFNQVITTNTAKRNTIDFSKQHSTASRILDKAKL